MSFMILFWCLLCLQWNCELLQWPVRSISLPLTVSSCQTICPVLRGGGCKGCPLLAASIATYIHRFPLILVQPALFWLMPQYHRSVRRFPAIIPPFTLYHGIAHIKPVGCTFIYIFTSQPRKRLWLLFSLVSECLESRLCACPKSSWFSNLLADTYTHRQSHAAGRTLLRLQG